MDATEQLYTAIALAREQQQAAQAAIDGLAAERAALAKERQALAVAAQDVQKAVGLAVGLAVRQSLDGASETAVAAFAKAAGPFTRDVQAVAAKASAAAAQVADAGRWLGVKAVALVAGLVVVAGLAAWGAVAWQRHQVDQLAEQAEQLQQQIAQEQATVDELDKRGGRVRWSKCDGRLCFEASSNQGQNAQQWSGAAWHNTQTGVGLVIPRGY